VSNNDAHAGLPASGLSLNGHSICRDRRAPVSLQLQLIIKSLRLVVAASATPRTSCKRDRMKSTYFLVVDFVVGVCSSNSPTGTPK
jgi:hypothetical protein